MRDVMFVLMLCPGYLASNKLNECPTTQKILNCENMVTSKGFTYHVPQNMTVYLRDRHCEHGWYDMNGTFIVDSTVDGEKLGSVVAVTPQNLTLSTCASLQWQIHCDNIQFHCIINYTVKHRATHDFLPENDTFTGDKEDAISLNWLIGVVVGSVVVFVTILSVTIWVFWEKIVRRSDYTPGEGGSEILNFESPSHKGHPYL